MSGNKQTNLIIYQKYLEMIYYTNDLVRKYPKSETFALVEEIKHTMYSGLRLLIYGLKLYNIKEKLKYLNELDINLNLMKVHIRLSYKYHHISMQNYTTWSNKITEICNLLGGLINSCLKR